MEHFAGLSVSVKDTSVCIVDDTGKIVREVKVASKPEALPYAGRSIFRMNVNAASFDLAQVRSVR